MLAQWKGEDNLAYADAPEIFKIDQSGVNRRQKLNENSIEIRRLFSLKTALNIHEMDLKFPKQYHTEKTEKCETVCVSKLPIWRQKRFARPAWKPTHWVCRVSPGKGIVVIFCVMMSFGQIKPGILKWTIKRGQSNFTIAFIFVSFKEKGYYRVVLVEQLSFNCRSYCEGSLRIQRITSHCYMTGCQIRQEKQNFIYLPYSKAKTALL